MRKRECKKRRIQISAYLDNELSKVNSLELEAHLAICEDCSAFFESMKMVSEEVSRMPMLEPGDAAVEALKRKIRSLDPFEERPSWFSSFSFARLGYAAAAVVVAFVSLMVWTHAPEQTPTMLAKDDTAEKRIAAKTTQSDELTANAPEALAEESDSDAAPFEKADSELDAARRRLIAGLTSDAFTEDSWPEAESPSASLASSRASSSAGYGRVVHSVYLGGRTQRRAPVASHVVYVSYGN